MGYDASVLVIYATTITNYPKFVQDFLDRHPEIAEQGCAEEFDMKDHDEAAEYVENFLDNIDGYDFIFTDDGIFVASFMHEHDVCRTRDGPKKLVLPTAKSMKKFDQYCARVGLPKPELLTVVNDSC